MLIFYKCGTVQRGYDVANLRHPSNNKTPGNEISRECTQEAWFSLDTSTANVVPSPCSGLMLDIYHLAYAFML